MNIKTKTVPFGGRSLTVSQLPDSLRTRFRLAEISARELTAAGESTSDIELHFLGILYPALVICTQVEDGLPLPTAAEVLDGDAHEANGWYIAVQEINPHLFPEDRPAEAEQDKKKRKRSRRTVQPDVQDRPGVG